MRFAPPPLKGFSMTTASSTRSSHYPTHHPSTRLHAAPSLALRSTLAGALLAALSMASFAQAPASAEAASSAPSSGMKKEGHGGAMGHHDPARMQAMVARHQANLKAQLKITPAQEGAWTTWTAAMQPPARMQPTAEQRAGMDKLPTPERIDKMRTLRSQRMTEMNARMDQRGQATKTFYAALTPEQQKTFDAETGKHMAARQGGHPGHSGHDGAAGPAGMRSPAAPPAPVLPKS
jgi:periplasmic protein CpxP/Spy